MLKSYVLKKTGREGPMYSLMDTMSIMPAKFSHWLRAGHLIRKIKINKELKSKSPAVHFGAGPTNLKGFINTDILCNDFHVNITKKLPFKDGSIAYVYHSHLIEHIYNREAKKFLTECHRIMKKGGVMRIATPDYRRLAMAAYTDNKDLKLLKEHHIVKSREKSFTPSNYLNEFTHMMFGHKFVYDYEYLSYLCKEAGFLRVYEVKINESRYPLLSGLEKSYKPYKKAQTLVIECVK